MEALCVVSLSPHFSRQLHAAIRLQAARPFEQALYDQALQGLYAHDATTEAVLATAIARSHGGD